MSRSSATPRHAMLAALLLSSAALIAGCDDHGSSLNIKTEDAPLYGISSLIFTSDSSTTYVALTNHFDAQPTVTLADAREFAGYAPVDAVGGAVFVGSGESPELRRLRAFDDHSWEEQESLGFGVYTSMPLVASIYVDADTAYAPFDETNHVVWNPSTMSIVSEIGAPEEIPLEREGLAVWRGYAHEHSGRYVYQTYYYASDDYHSYTETSHVAVFDTETDEIVSVVDVPCPHLHITSQDSDGNVYFSNGQGSIASAVLDDTQPDNCVARINAGETELDAAFTTHFTDLAEGREGSNFFVIGDGVALFNVYHAELDGIDDETVFGDVDFSSNYHLWKVDLGTMEAAPLEGVDYAGGQVVVFRIDGRTLLTIPAPDYSSTAVLEVDATGTVTELFDVEGWAFKMFRIR